MTICAFLSVICTPAVEKGRFTLTFAEGITDVVAPVRSDLSDRSQLLTISLLFWLSFFHCQNNADGLSSSLAIASAATQLSGSQWLLQGVCVIASGRGIGSSVCGAQL